MTDLHGAAAVVTRASSELGRRFALDLDPAGAAVVGLPRRAELLESLRARFRSSGSATVVCDATDRFVEVPRGLEHERGRTDMLINNAGVGEPDGDPIGTYRAVMETHFFAAAARTLAVLPGMASLGRGIVVNISSESGRGPGPGELADSASKAASVRSPRASPLRPNGRACTYMCCIPAASTRQWALTWASTSAVVSRGDDV
jgi:NADP-dependent 3-hydroxy acid dehydrogenase YdfG